MSSLVLDVFPEATGVLADFSEPMPAEAARRFGDRHRTVIGDMATPGWLGALNGEAEFNVVVSGLAIHHLADERKAVLFGQLFSCSSPAACSTTLSMSSPRNWKWTALSRCS